MIEGPFAKRVKEIDVELGARIRKRRRAVGLTQVKFGERLGVSFQQLQKYETGVNRIAVSTLVVMAEILAVSIIEILEDI